MDPWVGTWQFRGYSMDANAGFGPAFEASSGFGEIVRLEDGLYSARPKDSPEDALIVSGSVHMLERNIAYFESETEYIEERVRMVRIDEQTIILFNTSSGFDSPAFTKLWWSFGYLAILEKEEVPAPSGVWKGDYLLRHLSSSVGGFPGGVGYSEFASLTNVAVRVVEEGNGAHVAKTPFEIGDVQLKQSGDYLEAGFTNSAGLYVEGLGRVYQSRGGRLYYVYGGAKFDSISKRNLLSAEWGIGIEMATNAPPFIQSKTPSNDVIVVAEDRSLSFGVDARDPEGGDIWHQWTWDGEPVDGTNSMYTHHTQWGDAGVHELRCFVLDDFWTKENEIVTQWIVRVLSDNDGDGVSNDEERNIHGSDPENPDSDNDGMADGEEVVAGTTLTNASERFEIREIQRGSVPHGRGPAFSWDTKPGRRYDVSASTNLKDWFMVHQTNGSGARGTYFHPLTEESSTFLRLDVSKD